jgi:hypothetical protein
MLAGKDRATILSPHLPARFKEQKTVSERRAILARSGDTVKLSVSPLREICTGPGFVKVVLKLLGQ